MVQAGDYTFDRDRDPPSDIWLLNLRSRVTLRLTTQTLDDGQTRKGQWRTPPVWSPDSQQVAWVETDPDDSGNGRLAVYDITSRTINIWTRGLPLGFGEAGIFHVYDQLGWGSYIANIGTPLFGLTAPVVAAHIISEAGIVMEEPHAGSSWLLHERAWFLFVNDPLIPARQIFNPMTGERLGLVNPPLRQTVNGDGLRLRVVNNQIDIFRPDGSQTMLDTTEARNIQISPMDKHWPSCWISRFICGGMAKQVFRCYPAQRRSGRLLILSGHRPSGFQMVKPCRCPHPSHQLPLHRRKHKVKPYKTHINHRSTLRPDCSNMLINQNWVSIRINNDKAGWPTCIRINLGLHCYTPRF